MGFGGFNEKGFEKVVQKLHLCSQLPRKRQLSSIVFGVKMQDYFNFQVHAHTVVSELLIGKSWFSWNNLTLIFVKIIIWYTTNY